MKTIRKYAIAMSVASAIAYSAVAVAQSSSEPGHDGRDRADSMQREREHRDAVRDRESRDRREADRAVEGFRREQGDNSGNSARDRR